MALNDPATHQRNPYAQTFLAAFAFFWSLGSFQGPVQSRSQVLIFLSEAFKPHRLLRAIQLGVCFFCPLEVVVGMSLSGAFFFSVCLQALQHILTNCLEQEETYCSIRLLSSLYQVVVYERGYPIQK